MHNNIDKLYGCIDEVSVSEAYVCNPEKCSLLLGKIKKRITVISHNIRSISKNLNEFLLLVKRLKTLPDIIILTECWLSKCSNVPIIEGYDATSTTNHILQNDGVVVYIKSHIASVSYEPSFLNANCLISVINNDIAIVSLYRSPSYANLDNFIQSLDSALSDLSKYRTIIVIGDINLNILDSEVTKKSMDYLDLLAFHGLLPTHTLATRDTSCLDHIFLKTNNASLTLIIESSITDHCPTLIAIQNNNKISTSQKVTKVDYKAIKEDMAKIDFTAVFSSTDCNHATEELIFI